MVMHECGAELTLVSLFDGIGGFPRAFEGVARTVATCEIDPAAAGVAADHFPEAKAFTDVTELTADELLAAGFCPRCGILTGGWPCQDLSLAGRRLGLGGARSGLFWEIVRLARDLRPRWLVLENVPGLLSAVCSCPGLGVCGTGCTDPHPVRGGLCGSRGGRGGRCMEIHGGAMGAVLGALGELGYGFAYRVLDAAHFGVPQRRRRVVIVGCLGNGAAPAQVLLEPDGGAGNPAQGGTARTQASRSAEVVARGTGTAVNSLTTGSLSKYDDNSALGGHLVADTAPTLQDGGRRGYRIDAEMAAGGGLVRTPEPEVWQQQGSKLQPMGTMRRGNGNVTGGVPFVAMPTAATVTAREGKGPDSDATSTLVGHDVAYALRADPGGIGQGHNTNYVPLGGEGTRDLTAEGADASEDGTGRGTPIVAFGHADAVGPYPSDETTGTVRAGHNVGGGSVATAAAVRRLTPVECERLQGYPDGWTAASSGRPQSDSARYRQLGNSIAVPVFAWVARRLAAEHRRSS